jgi:hypothetical protein
MTSFRIFGSLGIATIAAACSATGNPLATTGTASTTSGMGGGTGTSSTKAASSGSTTTTTSTGMGGGTGFDAGVGGGSPGICTGENEAMYLFGGLGSIPALYKFLPATKALSMVGVVACQVKAGAQPFAMSVDRNANAWALFDSGQIFKLDTKTAACSQTGFLPGQMGFTTFGMGFVSDSQNMGTETLYITQADISPSDDQLGAIDTTQSPPVLSLVGHYNGGMGKPPPFVGAADATGTGDGRLFGFFRTNPVQIAQIDKSTAQILGVAQLPSAGADGGVSIGMAWAFAFWGGTFWLFTWDGVSTTGSKLQQYDPMANAVTTVSSGLGVVVVGAGVSTCAPLVPPK